MLLRALARGRLDADRLDHFVRRMSDASDRLSALLEDLLDVSRLRTGRLRLRLRRVDFARLVRESVAQHLLQHPDRSFSVDVGCDPAPVIADSDRLQQVLANLLSNAVKYSSSPGEVRVSLARSEDEWVLRVRDQGIGLPSGSAEKIFEPFGRAANAVSRNLPGMGLGLYLCRQIVHSHGGSIWAESAGEDRGTTFHVVLPARGEAPDG
jgi:signal transduction histidine kinase